MLKQKHSVNIDELGITISTGTLAQQAGGAVTIELGETIVFVSATMANTLRAEQDFLLLTVDYREKFSAAGRFPGGYFKREGRPTEKEILTSRLCDRSLRPLFPKGFINEMQIIGLLLSSDLANEPDILMVNGASASLMCSNIPFGGPVGCVRIGEINGKFIINPNNDQIFESSLDLIYVGNEEKMLMIEGSADQLPEERFIEALEFAHKSIQPIIKAQKRLADQVNKSKCKFEPQVPDSKVLELCKTNFSERLTAAVFQDQKQAREEAVCALKEEAKGLVLKEVGEETFDENQIRLVFEELQESLYRNAILHKDKRVDGRGVKDLRSLSAEIDLLPRVHGSATFERGETQTLVIATLGTTKDAQELDALTGSAASKSFILHYNFPPFSVGETGRFGFTSRREIGHGALAERSILPVLPPESDFPYSIRLVSEIMSSNGSTSMASICGGTLALMDAGVPISAPVAGISTGLVTECDSNKNVTKHVVLTDILGSEDHFGDMDFKIAGTRKGITGFQLDLKIAGLPFDIAKEAIYQNKDARIQILDVMDATIPKPRNDLKEHTPRLHELRIDPAKIGALIGPGGKNIKKIIEITGTQIDINDDNSGQVLIFSNEKAALQRAINEIKLIVSDIEVGKTYKGTVKSIKDFGAFVECFPGKEGLVHISELSDIRVEKVEDICQIGSEITVKCIDIDNQGKVRLSRKAAICEEQGIPYKASERPQSRSRDGSRGHGNRREHARR